jgi:hypothetical protein
MQNSQSMAPILSQTSISTNAMMTSSDATAAPSVSAALLHAGEKFKEGGVT